MNFREFLCNLIGRLYIPEELEQCSEKLLLHISDTPAALYSELRRLIKVLKPAYIVHTGDMVDNIKLQLYPNAIYEHEKWLKRLADILEGSGSQVIVALGNHDNEEAASRLFKDSLIIKDAATVDIEGKSFRISHMPKGILESPAEYNLFGHDLDLKSGCADDKRYYNGISYINIISLDSWKSTALRYPSGTDDERLGRHKIGL